MTIHSWYYIFLFHSKHPYELTTRKKSFKWVDVEKNIGLCQRTSVKYIPILQLRYLIKEE